MAKTKHHLKKKQVEAAKIMDRWRTIFILLLVVIVVYALVFLFVAFDCHTWHWFHNHCLWKLHFTFFPPSCTCSP